jgi:hypothetical protein
MAKLFACYDLLFIRYGVWAMGAKPFETGAWDPFSGAQ